MKFGVMYERAKELGCEYIATGHYAKTEYSEKYERWVLKKSKAGKKDQSYVLWNIPKELLSHILFPLSDFEEKARILKDGCFLVEMIPAENENNFDYLYKIKKMAQEAGFQYYAKVPWIKGTIVSNTGRKSKNSEDMMIFSKGKPRAMRPNVKKDLAEPDEKHYMSGTAKMLPTDFNVQAVPRKEALQSEKPVGLVEQLLDYLTFENELVLDQFAGSGVVGEACLNKNRNCILIEQDHERVEGIKKRLNMNTENGNSD
jgi:site-specific DNA-methyltransferase (adenine-specific)